MGSGLRDKIPAPAFNRIYRRGDRPDNMNHHLIKDSGYNKQQLYIESKSPYARDFFSLKKMALPTTFYHLSSGMEN